MLRTKQVTPSCDTLLLASGDVIADTQVFDNVFGKIDGKGILKSIQVLDKDDQGQNLDIVLLDANVSLGTENAAISISDADAENILGIINVTAFDDLIGSQIACMENLEIPINAISGTQGLALAVVCRGGTPTYTASGLVITLTFDQE